LAEPPSESEILDLVRLTMIPGVGPQTSRALLGKFGSAGRVLAATITQLRAVPNVGPKLADKISRAGQECDAEAELALCQRANVRVLPSDDPEYPPPLENIPDPPCLLYCKGSVEPRDQLAIAIVGSRHCTPYGMRVAERLAGGLARVGITVVSGLARGIDAAAHRGALKAGGRSIAVLANGLASVYPAEHKELADAMVQSGALVSEMAMRQRPLAALFTQRNRIISGISLGVLVVEATPRSGSLSTARHAVEQNREVFAVPGPVTSLSSRGCHRLIRDGARLVETVDDILEQLGPLVQPVRMAPEESAVRHPLELGLSDAERSLLGHLDDHPHGVDELITRTGLTASQVMATLSVLELKHLIRRLPGHQFVRF
jgi:DNA processing protein